MLTETEMLTIERDALRAELQVAQDAMKRQMTRIDRLTLALEAYEDPQPWGDGPWSPDF